jgi:hypothetical protein
MTRILTDQEIRLAERFELACEIIRLRDAIRTSARYGKPLAPESHATVRRLEQRFHETDPTPAFIREYRSHRSALTAAVKMAAPRGVEFPEWVR